MSIVTLLPSLVNSTWSNVIFVIVKLYKSNMPYFYLSDAITRNAGDDGDDDSYLGKLTLPSLHIVLVTWRHLISNDYETEIKDRRLFLLLTPPLKYAWVINSLPFAVT